MKALITLNLFSQGYGGLPESARLLARSLDEVANFSVLDQFGYLDDIAQLHHLPSRDNRNRKNLVKGKFDLGLIFGPWQMPTQIHRFEKSLKSGAPIIYLPRGGLADIEFLRTASRIKKRLFLSFFERSRINRSKAIVFSSELERRNSSILNARVQQHVVIPDFVDTTTFTKPRLTHFQCSQKPKKIALTEDSKNFRLGVLCEIQRRKNVDGIVQAVQLHNSRSDKKVTLLIHGGPKASEQSYYQDLKERFNENRQIRFLGPLRHNDRNCFFSNLDALCVPSFFESYGLTVAEAINAGLPVLASPKVGICEFLNPQDPSIVICNGTDVASFCNGISEIIHRSQIVRSDPEVLNRINRRAVELWKSLLESHK